MKLVIEQLDAQNAEHRWAAEQVAVWTRHVATVGTSCAQELLEHPLGLVAFDSGTIDDTTGWRTPAGHIAQVWRDYTAAGDLLVKIGRHVNNPAEQYQSKAIGRLILEEMLTQIGYSRVSAAFAFVNDVSAKPYQQVGADIAWHVRDPQTMPEAETGCLHLANLLPAIAMMRAKEAAGITVGYPDFSFTNLLEWGYETRT